MERYDVPKVMQLASGRAMHRTQLLQGEMGALCSSGFQTQGGRGGFGVWGLCWHKTKWILRGH